MNLANLSHILIDYQKRSFDNAVSLDQMVEERGTLRSCFRAGISRVNDCFEACAPAFISTICCSQDDTGMSHSSDISSANKNCGTHWRSLTDRAMGSHLTWLGHNTTEVPENCCWNAFSNRELQELAKSNDVKTMVNCGVITSDAR
jgi:nicotinamidase-related amidase